ncbi:MAG: EscU/YscU/HrcU family type III secretion system export apparatus switch protein [Micromonosporaceae bacterium]|nr:EscU/YscU/HrcU family type III secretion system export apparatus switch protein [Micromonosporaceae bacterium]
MSSEEKTEQPTEQKKKQAKSEGQIPKTPDFSAWGGLLIASVLIPMTVESMAEDVQDLMSTVAELIEEPAEQRMLAFFGTAMLDAALVAAPLCGSLFLFSIAAFGVQGGLKPAAKLFIPKFNRLNPLTGFKRIVGPTAAWEAVKALAKTFLVGIVLYTTIKGLAMTLMGSGSIPLLTLLSIVGDAANRVIQLAAIAGVVLAGADYAMSRRRIGKQIKMSKQEVKEEHRRTEGDPQIKQAVRARQFAMSRQRMMAELPKADVVLVNPTQVAVALRYDPARGAPRVIAKGAGSVATKIREKAMELRIPMVQDKALSRALYRGCELGDEIPADFYEAVARVLAFVMVLKSKGSAAGLHHPTATG